MLRSLAVLLCRQPLEDTCDSFSHDFYDLFVRVRLDAALILEVDDRICAAFPSDLRDAIERGETDDLGYMRSAALVALFVYIGTIESVLSLYKSAVRS